MFLVIDCPTIILSGSLHGEGEMPLETRSQGGTLGSTTRTVNKRIDTDPSLYVGVILSSYSPVCLVYITTYPANHSYCCIRSFESFDSSANHTINITINYYPHTRCFDHFSPR